MIRPAQRKLLDRARAAAAPDANDFTELLRRCGGADRVEDLTASGYARLVDGLTVRGFRDRKHPILSRQTREWIENAFPAQLKWTPFAFKTVLLSKGISDTKDMDGTQLLNLIIYLETFGFSVWAFNTARRAVTEKQSRLLQLARKKIELPDNLYYPALQRFGGVNTASDLDRRGFDLVMAYLEAEGFERAPAAPAGPVFGRRPGFATPEQVDLIRTLWREWNGPTAESEAAVEAALNTWLERYHGASSLRFLSATGAAKVITALKAMKARKGVRETSDA